MRQDTMRLRRAILSDLPILKTIGGRLKVSVNRPVVEIELDKKMMGPKVKSVLNTVGELCDREGKLRKAIMRQLEPFGEVNSMSFCRGRGFESVFITLET